MAQPSVAREPSMEEILASIRRIIESNDPVTESVNTRASREVETDFEDDDEGFVLSDEGGNPFLSQVPANDPGSPITRKLRFFARHMMRPRRRASRLPSLRRKPSRWPMSPRGCVPRPAGFRSRWPSVRQRLP